MIPANIITDQNFSQIIKSGTGLLNSQERFERIKNIAEFNIILAAQCKNTCVDEEDSIVTYLIYKSYKLFESMDSPIDAIICLLEMGEYYSLSKCLEFKYNFSIPESELKIFIIDRCDFYQVLTYITNKLPNNISYEIFTKIKSLNQAINVDFYNGVLNISNSNDVYDVYKEMKLLGIEPNVKTFSILITKSKDLNQSIDIYNELKIKINNNHKLICESLFSIISNCDDYNIASYFYNELKQNDGIIRNSEQNEYLYNDEKIIIQNLKNESEKLSYRIKNDEIEINLLKEKYALIENQIEKVKDKLKKESNSNNQIKMLSSISELENDLNIIFNSIKKKEIPITTLNNLNKKIIYTQKMYREKKSQIKIGNKWCKKAIPLLIRLSPDLSTALKYFESPENVQERNLKFKSFVLLCTKIDEEILLYEKIAEYINLRFNIKTAKRVINENEKLDIVFTKRYLKIIRKEELRISLIKLLLNNGYEPSINSIFLILSEIANEEIVLIMINKLNSYKLKRHTINEVLLGTCLENNKFDISVIIMNILKEKGIKGNEIMYNTLIKKSPTFSDAKALYSEMIENKLLPDKFSFAPLLRKVDNINSFFKIVEYFTDHSIYFDNLFKKIITNSIENNLIEFLQIFPKVYNELMINIDKSIYREIDQLYKKYQNLSIFNCEIYNITSSRVYVKIENSENGSIYIAELGHEKLNSIFDFKYNGIPLHIGQKLKAASLGYDSQNRHNLSIKLITKKSNQI